jgi:uncharacterized membrane protein
MRHLLPRPLAVVIFLSVVPAAFGADYTFIPIVFPGATLTVAFDIKNSGAIIGEYGCCVGPLASNSFLLSHGTFTTLPDFPGADATNTTSMNSEGDIVGLYIGGGVQHGFVRSRKGVFSSIDYPGATVTQVWGLNDRRQIIGSREDGAPGFVFFNGIFTPIAAPGASTTTPRGINNAGDVVGFYSMDVNVHGFLLSEGTFTTIDFPGALNTYLFGMNNRGDVVGTYQLVPSGPSHGFILSNGVFETIDAPGFSNTGLYGLNDVGDIVGSAFNESELSAEGILVTKHPRRFQR